LTLGIAYLTVYAHERNRTNQALALRSQARVLNGLLEPIPEPPRLTRAELAREERSTFIEASKDRWNNEIEHAVRWVQNKDWSEVRESLEDQVARLWGKEIQRSRDVIQRSEDQARPRVQEAVDRSRVAATEGAHSAAAGVEHAGVKAREAADLASVKSKQAADYAGRTGGAVRGAVQKGIEKGKEVATAVGAALTTAKDDIKGAIELSEVEKALQQRYVGSSSIDQTVEEALAERYTPIDKRDNSVLRGV
jgi:altered-inheritance-of-mitochondria protein 5